MPAPGRIRCRWSLSFGTGYGLGPVKAERADYICEMKFSESKYVLKEEDAEDITGHIDALMNSSIHKPTHSIYVALVTTFGMTDSKHRSHINDLVTLDSLFV